MRNWIGTLLYSMITASVHAVTFYTDTIDGITWKYYTSGNSAILGGYGEHGYERAISTSTIGAITIPTTLGGYPVVRIDPEAFRSCSKLTSVTIPAEVTTIRYNAFMYCSALETLVLPPSITIEEDCFRYCSNIQHVTISGQMPMASLFPDSVVKITDVVVTNGSTFLCANFLNGCSSITNVVLPNSLNTIERSAFYGLSGLYSFVIPDSSALLAPRLFPDATVYKSIQKLIPV